MKLNFNGNILHKTKQVCAHADDITLKARNLPAIQEMSRTVETAEKLAGLVRNEDKTKYMMMEVNQVGNMLQEIKIGNHTFEKKKS